LIKFLQVPENTRKTGWYALFDFFNAIWSIFEKVDPQKILVKRGGTQFNPQKILLDRGGTQIGTF
jgi:hypothetical protein